MQFLKRLLSVPLLPFQHHPRLAVACLLLSSVLGGLWWLRFLLMLFIGAPAEGFKPDWLFVTPGAFTVITFLNENVDPNSFPFGPLIAVVGVIYYYLGPLIYYVTVLFGTCGILAWVSSRIPKLIPTSAIAIHTDR